MVYSAQTTTHAYTMPPSASFPPSASAGFAAAYNGGKEPILAITYMVYWREYGVLKVGRAYRNSRWRAMVARGAQLIFLDQNTLKKQEQAALKLLRSFFHPAFTGEFDPLAQKLLPNGRGWSECFSVTNQPEFDIAFYLYMLGVDQYADEAAKVAASYRLYREEFRRVFSTSQTDSDRATPLRGRSGQVRDRYSANDYQNTRIRSGNDYGTISKSFDRVTQCRVVNNLCDTRQPTVTDCELPGNTTRAGQSTTGTTRPETTPTETTATGTGTTGGRNTPASSPTPDTPAPAVREYANPHRANNNGNKPQSCRTIRRSRRRSRAAIAQAIARKRAARRYARKLKRLQARQRHVPNPATRGSSKTRDTKTFNPTTTTTRTGAGRTYRGREKAACSAVLVLQRTHAVRDRRGLWEMWDSPQCLRNGTNARRYPGTVAGSCRQSSRRTRRKRNFRGYPATCSASNISRHTPEPGNQPAPGGRHETNKRAIHYTRPGTADNTTPQYRSRRLQPGLLPGRRLYRRIRTRNLNPKILNCR